MILVFLFKETHLIKWYLLKDRKKIILYWIGIGQVIYIYIYIYNANIVSYCDWARGGDNTLLWKRWMVKTVQWFVKRSSTLRVLMSVSWFLYIQEQHMWAFCFNGFLTTCLGIILIISPESLNINIFRQV